MLELWVQSARHLRHLRLTIPCISGVPLPSSGHSLTLDAHFGYWGLGRYRGHSPSLGENAFSSLNNILASFCSLEQFFSFFFTSLPRLPSGVAFGLKLCFNNPRNSLRLEALSLGHLQGPETLDGRYARISWGTWIDAGLWRVDGIEVK